MDMEYRIIRAVNLIENNLSNPIKSEDIAHEAGMSVRHLYRNFHLFAGDTVKNYLRGRRLTQASKELVDTKRSALDIALDYQFQSPEVFCRAFTRQFWLTPRAFRQIGSPYNATQRKPASNSEIQIVQKGEISSPRIINMPPRWVVGQRTTQSHYAFRVDSNLVEAELTCKSLREDIHKIAHLVDASEWSVTFRDNELTEFHEMENFYCVEVKKLGHNPEQYDTQLLPAAKYAVFRHESSDTYVESTISLAFSWLKNSPYFFGDAPTMFHSTPMKQFSGDLYIPISDTNISQRHWWRGYSEILSKRLKA
jgi:AraC family transcriptional regulator